MSDAATFIWRRWVATLCAGVFAAFPTASLSDERGSPIYVLFEFEEKDLEVYTRSLVDILNVLRFRDITESAPPFPEEREDIIFISQRGSLRGGEYAQEILDLIGPEYAPALKSAGAAGERCSVQGVLFTEERTIVGIQDVGEGKLDIKCLHLTFAHFLGLEARDLQGFFDLSEEKQLIRLIELNALASDARSTGGR